ncbi:lysophospholipid acyltransferase family protein [Reichenbachiella ulvae]|uniref:1-acyl-sn-glycerol-3-phosphate acyltransferase n=1 Tax=Reichenbachiella ulvae TaxID=2980104 RepID=A0ABT3CNE9_9BACT|nr:lysophospholipid acyltransferase family protein [Reichenbachiella ulvae]MCV9385248.1 1-acyl-sn-glycerol-3-phosphate acyltransferase [Reichenbachiella ulvae]
MKHNIFLTVILRVYGLFAALLLTLTFLLLFPFFVLADWCGWKRFGLQLNHFWSKIYFPLVGIPVHVEYQGELDPNQSYIFCPNHFSYLDVAILPQLKMPFMYVGKISLAKVPMFGYMFKAFHITVDREKMRQRYATYQQSIEALKNGFSLAIFPEGGIKTENPPKMTPKLKEGPFRMSIETGTPIVPVTLADNWRMFPTDSSLFFYRRKCRVLVHEPIDPKNFNMDQIKEYQSKVHQTIQSQLDQMNS